jgi:hypothetical protein
MPNKFSSIYITNQTARRSVMCVSSELIRDESLLLVRKQQGLSL